MRRRLPWLFAGKISRYASRDASTVPLQRCYPVAMSNYGLSLRCWSRRSWSSSWRCGLAYITAQRRTSLLRQVLPVPRRRRPRTDRDPPRGRPDIVRVQTGACGGWGEAEADKSCRSSSKCFPRLEDTAADVRGPTATLPGDARPSSG